MKVSTRFVIPLLAFVLTSLPQATAQEETWNIVTVGDDTLLACTLDSLMGTSLGVHHDEGLLLIPIDSVKSIFRDGESAFIRAARIGGWIGAVGGLVASVIHFSDVESPYSWLATAQAFNIGAGIVGRAALAGAGGFLIGGAIGAARGPANSYELEMKTSEEKLQILRPLTISGKTKLANNRRGF